MSLFVECSNPLLRYLTPPNLLVAITVLAITNGVLSFTIFVLLLKVDHNMIGNIQCYPKSVPSPRYSQPTTELKKGLPVFTREAKWKDYTYRYYIGDDFVPWPSALNKCKEQGFKSLYVETVEERNFLLEWVSHKNDSGIPFVSNLHIWTSGYRDYNLTHWLWEATGESVTHHLWSPGEPNNDFDNQRCVSLYFWNREKIVFSDSLCMNRGRYICKLKNYPEK